MSHLRWMITKDLDSVVEIDSHQDLAWCRQDFIELLRKKSIIAMVAELPGEKVVGFMVYELLNTRINLLRVGVTPEHRRKGIGTELIAKLTGKLSHNKRRKIAVEVRETNLPFQLFLRSLGFLAVEVLRSYYDDTGEDAYVFHYSIALDPPTKSNETETPKPE